MNAAAVDVTAGETSEKADTPSSSVLIITNADSTRIVEVSLIMVDYFYTANKQQV